MKHYLDITLLPDAESNLGFLWHKVYKQIHFGLVGNKTTDGMSLIAASFPEYGSKIFPMGSKIRLFCATEAQLKKLSIDKYLSRLTDYTHITPIKEVPLSVEQYACFSRKAVISNFLKKAVRRAEHLGKPLDEVIRFIEKQDKERGIIYESTLPFINMESQQTKKSIGSSGQYKFRLFVKKTAKTNEAQGHFSCYGLSKTATTPWF